MLNSESAKIPSGINEKKNSTARVSADIPFQYYPNSANKIMILFNVNNYVQRVFIP